ncbi:methyltransferase domain-containing protein [Streptomyces violens]|uniref:methyltransferase domain-containing protein n=1 Tax=Streptomyces violens TaxID=66377 RepID=UPI0012FEB768|nr:methyltransferase domain-containing protein [Streptomyces violens]
MDRTLRPRQWLKAVYRPGAPLITQIDDGAVLPEAPVSSDAFTSSISCARVVVTMLRRLEPRPGETLLEIGTGTGYNTALLCHRLGDQAVTSIEVDAGLAATAAHHLKDLGLHPHLVTGDGTEGHAARAPYDHFLPTACVQRVPTARIQQVRAGGRILPLTTPLGTDALLSLTTEAPAAPPAGCSPPSTSCCCAASASVSRGSNWAGPAWPTSTSASTKTNSTSAYHPRRVPLTAL